MVYENAFVREGEAIKAKTSSQLLLKTISAFREKILYIFQTFLVSSLKVLTSFG